MKAKAILTMILAAALLGAGMVALMSCNSQAAEQNAIANQLNAEAALKRAEGDRARAVAEAAAERERAEADRLQAEAESYQRRTEAATLAEIERAAIRQAERNASHERIIETLPFLVLIVGVLIVGALAVVMLTGRQGQPVDDRDPEQTWLLQQRVERQDRLLADLERNVYHAIATEQRRRHWQPATKSSSMTLREE